MQFDEVHDLSDDNAEVADEATTNAGDRLLASLEQEVKTMLRQRKKGRSAAGGRVVCPFCPFRSWTKHNSSRLFEHASRYHSAKQQFTASGTKQLKMIIALHDQDRLQGSSSEAGYLRRRADILRNTVKPPLPGNVNNINRLVRLVYTRQGPEY